MASVKSASLLLAGLWLSPARASVPAATSYSDAFIVEAAPSHGSLNHDFLDEVSKAVSQLGPSCRASARNQFNSPFFTGASFNVDCDSNIDRANAIGAIKNLATVGKAWPVSQVNHQALTGVGANGVTPVKRGAGTAHDGRYSGSPTRRGAQPSAQPYNDTFSTHVMSGVDRLHAAGITGAGIRIAVVDSGFDMTVHGLSETKVTFTWDVTANSSVVSDDCSFHGTHVLGIVGAHSADNQYGVNGVARDASFELYRIQSCSEGGSSDDNMIAAFLMAAGRGVDVITCSYGGAGAYPEEPMGLVASRIAANGTFFTTGAGNGGPSPFSGTNPGTDMHLTSVGSVDNTLQPCIQWQGSLTMGGQTEAFGFTPGTNMSFPAGNLSVWSPAERDTPNTPSNCSFVQTELPKDQENTILLINEYQCWVDSDGDRILSSKYNFKYVMFYSLKAPEGLPENCPDVEEVDGYFGVIQVNYTTGAAVQAELSKGDQVEVTIPSNADDGHISLTNTQNSAGGLLSYFSSWGPSFDVRSMPTVVSPGQFILSTFPKRIGSWAIIGGVSMATPFTAGVAALIKQQNKNLTAAQIQSIMAVTGRPIKWNSRQYSPYVGQTKDYLAPVLAQGGGLLDAWAASHTKTVLNVSSLSFNDTAHRPSALYYEISNMADEERVYNFEHIGAASGYFLNTTGGAKYNLTLNSGLPIYAQLSFNPQSVQIAPGKTAVVSVSVAAEPAMPDGVSFFGGYVAINVTSDSAEVESLTLPYTGIGGNLASLPMVNRDQSFGGGVNVTTSVVMPTKPGRVFTCAYKAHASTPCTFVPDGLVPGAEVNIIGQSRNATLDLVAYPSGSLVLSRENWADSADQWWNPVTWWNATDSNSTFLPPGDYAWRFTALRINGDSGTAADWDIWESNYWTLKYAANSTGLPSISSRSNSDKMDGVF